MTHLVLDSTTLDALIAAGDAVNHAAANRLCTCEYNRAYDGAEGKRVVVTQCFRCRAIAQWSEARAKAQSATVEHATGVAAS